MQLDNQEMQTNQDIRNEVLAILERRGFDVWWAGGHRHCAIRDGQLWPLHHSQTCNWIIKK